MTVSIDNWDDLRLFLTTVRAGSVAAASKTLRVDPTTVTRRMAAFEQATGRKLFDRLRGGVILSPDGVQFMEGAMEAEQAIQTLERQASTADSEVQGPVRVAIQAFLALAWMEPLLTLARSAPGLVLEFAVGDEMHNLTRREADIAVRVTQHPPAHLVGRKVGHISVAVYGTTALAKQGILTAPWVGWTGLQDDEGENGRMRRRLGATGPFLVRANSYAVVLELVARGAGVILLPCAVGDTRPELVRLTDPEVVEYPLWVLTHPDLQRTPRIRHVMEGLVELIHSREAQALGRGV